MILLKLNKRSYLQIGQGSQGWEQSHCLSGSRRSTEHQRLVFGKPCVQQGLVANRVYRWDDHVWRSYFVCFNLNLWNFRLPWHPFSRYRHLQIQSYTCIFLHCIRPPPPQVILRTHSHFQTYANQLHSTFPNAISSSSKMTKHAPCHFRTLSFIS